MNFSSDLVPSIPRKEWAPFVLLLVSFFVAVWGSSYLYAHGHTYPGLISPSAGIAIAGLVLGGRGLWPAVFLGGFLGSISAGNGVLYALVIAFAQALQAAAGAWLLRELGFNTLMSRLRDALALIGAALLPTMIVPTVSTFARIAIAHTAALEGAPGVWGSLWMGQVFSVIVIAPLLIRWLSRYRVVRTRKEWIEIAISFAFLAAVDTALFWSTYTQIVGVSLIYLLLVPFFWIALRVGPRFMTVAIFLNAVIEVAGVLSAYGSAPAATLGTRLLQVEIFSAIISFIFIVLVSAIEERKDAGNALSREVSKLERAVDRIRREDSAKNEFIAILAHELRNPLAPIVSSLELIQFESIGAGAKKWVGVIEDHTKTMRRLLDDLLDISRVSQGKFRIEKEPVDVAETLELALETAHPFIESKKHHLSVVMPERQLIVLGDQVRLEQVFINILNNAARYTEPGGTIEARCVRDGDDAIISVKDTGIGIAREVLPHIFEPFVQGGTQKPGSAGLGIGLALSKRLVEMHAGSIAAASKGPGHGSEFMVRLPLSRSMVSKRATARARLTHSLTPMEHSYRILIVDDNEAAAESLGKLLEYRGHAIHLEHQGAGALRAAREFKPDVVILDIGLPDIDGYQVARQLRDELGSQAFLIALTGYGQPEDRRLAEDAGFDHHFTKPVGLRDIELVLGRRS